MTKLLEKRAPFTELNTDRRKSMSESVADDFAMLLRSHLDEQLQLSPSGYKLFNVWFVQFNPDEKDRYQCKSPDATCAASRWLKTNWNGELINQEEFSRFFGVIAGAREYHSALMQIQEIAISKLPVGHPLTTASNITFMIQLMFAHVLTYCVKKPVTFRGFGTFSKKQSNKRFSLEFRVHEERRNSQQKRSADNTNTSTSENAE